MRETPRILIIDDEEVILDSCSRILQGAGYEVATAKDGARGLEAVEEFGPDLVFVDLRMPGLSGFEVVEEIRRRDPTIVTVAITGYATVDHAVEAMKRGTYDFLPKPFTPEEFRLMARRALERRRLLLETVALKREKEMLREHFAAIVSHELKSPLAALQQNLFALTEDLRGTASEKQIESLERMKERVDDLLELIHSWLRGIGVDVERLRENFRPVSVEAAVARAVETVEPHAVRKDIRLLTSVEDGDLVVLGDEAALAEAIVVLLGNAVKYSHVGSEVRLTVEHRDGHVAVAVADRGVGIPEEEIPRVLEGLFRASTGQGEEGGHGLGLVVARRIVEAHGGTLSAESRVGEGSTFTIVLPLHEGEANGPRAGPAAPEPEEARTRTHTEGDASDE